MKNKFVWNKKITFVILSALLAMVVYFVPMTSNLENRIFDIKTALLKEVRLKDLPSDNDLVIVDVDSESLEKFGGNIGYDQNTLLLEKARKEGAKAVFFLYPPSGGSDDTARKLSFARSMTTIPVYLTSYFKLDMNHTRGMHIVGPDPLLASKAAGISFILPQSDNDGVLRKKKLAVKWGEKVFPAVDLAIISCLNNAKSSGIIYENSSIHVGELKIPTDKSYQTGYIPIDPKKFETISFKDFINSDKIPSLKGKVIIAGWSANNKFIVKNPGLFRSNVSYLNTITSSVYSVNRGIMTNEFPEWVNILLILYIMILLGCYIPGVEDSGTFRITGIVLFSFLGVSLVAYTYGYNIPLAAILLGAGAFVAVLKLHRIQKSRAIGDLFAPVRLIEVLNFCDNKGEIESKVCNGVVLFADIKGYTTFSERYNPLIIMDMLNEYFSAMNQVVTENGGVVLSYQGDSFLAVFGLDDIGEKEACFRASKSALMMNQALINLRRKWQMEYRELFVIGIGISKGEVAVGMLGDKNFRQYTCIGDTVNLAARLVGVAKDLRVPVVIDEPTYTLIRSRAHCTYIKQSFLKGKTTISRVYQLEGYREQPGLATNPGVKYTDTHDTALLKKMKYYNDVKELMGQFH